MSVSESSPDPNWLAGLNWKGKMMKRMICFLVLMVASWHATAQMYIEPGLTKDENKILEVIGAKNVAYANYVKSTSMFERVKENIRLVGLLLKCEKLLPRGGPDKYHFDPALRMAINRVVDKTNAGKIVPTSTEIYRWQQRPLFWALSELSEVEKTAFFNFISTPEGGRAIEHYLSLKVLTQYPQNTRDVGTGKRLPVAMLLLKNYFKEANQLELFYKIFEKLSPNLLETVKALPAIEVAKEADIEKYRSLTEQSDVLTASFEKAFYDLLSETEQKHLIALFESPLLILLNDALHAHSRARDATMLAAINKLSSGKLTPPVSSAPPVAPSIPFNRELRKDDSYYATILAWMNYKYPEPKNWRETMWKLGPKEFSDNAHLEFCPPTPSPQK